MLVHGPHFEQPGCALDCSSSMFRLLSSLGILGESLKLPCIWTLLSVSPVPLMTQLISLSGFDFIFFHNMLLVKSLPSASNGLLCPAQGPTPPATYTLLQEGQYQSRYSHRVCPEDHRLCEVGARATWMVRVYFLEEVLFYLPQVWERRSMETRNSMCCGSATTAVVL